MKWIVSAKSGTSFDRETRRRSGITLPLSASNSPQTLSHVATYVMKPASNHAKPIVQPMVLSPRTDRQSRMSGKEKFCPRTRVVKTIRIVAVV